VLQDVTDLLTRIANHKGPGARDLLHQDHRALQDRGQIFRIPVIPVNRLLIWAILNMIPGVPELVTHTLKGWAAVQDVEQPGALEFDGASAPHRARPGAVPPEGNAILESPDRIVGDARSWNRYRQDAHFQVGHREDQVLAHSPVSQFLLNPTCLNRPKGSHKSAQIPSVCGPGLGFQIFDPFEHIRFSLLDVLQRF